MIEAQSFIAIAALAVGILSLVLTRIDAASKASRLRVRDLENEVGHLRQEIEACQRECRRLREENIELQRMLLHLKNNTGKTD